MIGSLGFSSHGFSSGHGIKMPRNPLQQVSGVTAVKVAKLFLTQGIGSVELYGSISREGVGNDLDLILIVDEEKMYQDFVAETKIFVEVVGVSHGSFCRLLAARRISPWLDHVCCSTVFATIHPGINELLDVYLMPQNWRDRIDEIQSHLPHSDPCFVKNIAKDARVIAEYAHI